MNIKELVNVYLSKGNSLRNSQNLAAEEIVLKKIASSNMAERVTLKGGIVMYNLTKSDRRVTQDIDFDLLRYSIDKDSIRLFVNKLNRGNDGFDLHISGDIEDLHQEDYQGVRVHIIINDKDKGKLKLKLDIGVHTYSAIEQEKIMFSFASDSQHVSIKVNPPEQIVAEKLLSLSRLGALSTRYKDLYDVYYLVKEHNVSAQRVSSILELFLNNSKRKPNSITELINAIEDTLNNNAFIAEASKPASKWIDDDFSDIRDTIINFVHAL